MFVPLKAPANYINTQKLLKGKPHHRRGHFVTSKPTSRHVRQSRDLGLGEVMPAYSCRASLSGGSHVGNSGRSLSLSLDEQSDGSRLTT